MLKCTAMDLRIQTTVWLLALSYPSLGVTSAQEETEVLPPGYTALEYTPSPAGTYELPALGTAVDGEVIDSDERALRLHSLFGDKIALLSFIYTSCSDIQGCPLATTVLQKIKSRLKSESLLSDKLRLISLSFDPAHDTPQAMSRYGTSFSDSGVEWRFLTTSSEAKLKPILEGYNQSIQRDYDENGQPLGTISHILRVFLIDRAKRIRNIYSVSFLHEEVLINDIKTLLLEEGLRRLLADASDAVSIGTTSAMLGAGDYKSGYERPQYETHSRALISRKGKQADLLSLVQSPPLGLPRVPVPADNAISEPKIALGRRLFYDRRLSLNNTFSCAMCHIPEQGFTSNEMATAVGVEGRTVRRNAPTLYNTAYLKRLFHDGREFTLEQQVWSPLLAKNEMGNPSVGWVIEKIRRLPEYGGLFEEAFDGKGPSMETVGMAIASYERTLLSGGSAFDRWYYGQDENALGKGARRGFELFTGKAGCVACHTVGENDALFTDNRLHNTGIGYRESMAKDAETREVSVAPGVVLKVPSELMVAVAEPQPNDLGFYKVTQHPSDRWKYKTPSLRNVALTAPYMHNGSLSTLRDVVEFYNRGGVQNELLDPLIRPLNFTPQEMDDLTAFLESLTGDNVDMLVSDAFAAPTGDVTDENLPWARSATEGR